jgi:hypothetical protein
LAKNIDVPGNPIVINITKKEMYHKFGELYHKLPNNKISLVLKRLLIHSTNKNSDVVENE